MKLVNLDKYLTNLVTKEQIEEILVITGEEK